MNKDNFIQYLSKKNRRPQKHYQEAIAEILAGIQDQLKEGKRIRFIGFGDFYTRVVKAHTGINPKTKAKIDVPENRYPAFKVGDVLTRAVIKKQPLQKKGILSKIPGLRKKA